jgi:hypothetical protein
LKQLGVTATTEKVSPYFGASLKSVVCVCLQKKQERDKRREEAATRAKSQRDTELVQIIKVGTLLGLFIALSSAP